MHTETIAFPADVPGTVRHLTVHRFGPPDARPAVHIQAGLHADEIPPMLVADVLRRRLTELDAAGAVIGSVTLVPFANPVGAAQAVLGEGVGRFDLADGGNFNRGYPDLTDAAADRVRDRLGPDAAGNADLVRAALLSALDAQTPAGATARMKHALLRLGLAADFVLDMHCDNEAAMHLYTNAEGAETFGPLARLLGARAILVADHSGGEPYDEAISRPWQELARRFPAHPMPVGGRSTTLELRGEADVDHATAAADADAVLGWLCHAGVLAGAPPPLPGPLCAPTPLAAALPLEAPAGGILVYRSALGTAVAEGTVVADIVDPVDGTVHPVRAGTDGVFFARLAVRFVRQGGRIGKIAGTVPVRTGPLLGA